jgi:heme exporter protein C
MGAKPRLLTIVDVLSLILIAVALWIVLFYAPMEAVMGNVQRVFYFHVSAGWVGMFSFFVSVIAGVFYLRTSDRKWDIIGLAGVEVGLVFAFVNIVSGSIWARPIWNTWWTWDPRLVTATIMELVYFAYLMLRQGIDDPDRRARFGAIYAILGFASVPLTFLSIRIFRTIHPLVMGASGSDALGSFSMTPKMRLAFFFSLFVFTVLGVDLLWRRIRLGYLNDKVEKLKMKMMG